MKRRYIAFFCFLFFSFPQFGYFAGEERIHVLGHLFWNRGNGAHGKRYVGAVFSSWVAGGGRLSGACSIVVPSPVPLCHLLIPGGVGRSHLSIAGAQGLCPKLVSERNKSRVPVKPYELKKVCQYLFPPFNLAFWLKKKKRKKKVLPLCTYFRVKLTGGTAEDPHGATCCV